MLYTALFNSMELQLSGSGQPLKSHDFVAFSKKCKNITTQHTDMTKIDLKRVKCNLWAQLYLTLHTFFSLFFWQVIQKGILGGLKKKKKTHWRPTILHHALVYNRCQSQKVPCHYQRKLLQHPPLHHILVADPIWQLIVQKRCVVSCVLPFWKHEKSRVSSKNRPQN